METHFPEDDRFLVEAACITESLRYLTFLIREEKEHPEKVDFYIDQAEERLCALWDLLHSRR